MYINVKLLAEHHLDFLSLKGGCTGSSESTLVKRSHCLKSHVAAKLCCVPSAVKISFWYLLMLCVNFSVKSLNVTSYFKPILEAIFVTIEMVKVKLIPDFYAWTIVLINQYGLIMGGQKSGLMHIALYDYSTSFSLQFIVQTKS